MTVEVAVQAVLNYPLQLWISFGKFAYLQRYVDVFAILDRFKIIYPLLDISKTNLERCHVILDLQLQS